MQHLLHVYANIITIDFLGFTLNVRKDWYHTHYLAIDQNGVVYIYDTEPTLKSSNDHWLIGEFASTADYTTILDLGFYDIPEINDWVDQVWDKQYWKLDEFPVLRTA